MNKLSPSYSRLEQGATNAAGERVGKWSFYSDKAATVLEMKFDYDSSRINFIREDTTRYMVRVGEEWLRKRVARQPHILGSNYRRQEAIMSAIHWPKSWMQQNKEGTLLIGFIVGADGHARNYTLEQSISAECDLEVLRALQKQPDMWVPAIYRGQPVDAQFYQLVKFRIVAGSDYRYQLQQRSKPTWEDGTPVSEGQPHYVHEITFTIVDTHGH